MQDALKVIGIMFAIAGVFALVIVGGTALVAGGFIKNWVNDGVATVQKEVAPSAILMKYRLMLSQQNSLEELNANIQIFEKQLDSISASNHGVKRTEWAASDREQYDNIDNAVVASKITFNRLAAQYNSEMKDISWSFANQAQLPDGATVVLNREFVPYQV
jgi:hypothetical protein